MGIGASTGGSTGSGDLESALSKDRFLQECAIFLYGNADFRYEDEREVARACVRRAQILAGLLSTTFT